jgi:UPF0755 protein
MRFVLPAIGLALVVGLVAFSSLSWPYAGFRDQVILNIPRGTSSSELAGMLQNSGVVRYRWQFLVVRAHRPRVKLQAGEYRFDRPASAWRVFNRLARGDVLYYELRVPEGSTIFDIAVSLDRLELIGREEFLKVAKDPKLVQDLAPRAPSLEGYLFPSTYRLTRQTTAPQLAKLMTDQFRRAWKETAEGKPGVDVHEVVTLASLVETETAEEEERPLVAGVFRNRLEGGMRLQCDPTVVYAAQLEGKFRGTIYRSDLARLHPYNTYQVAGLPPGPIANPGTASLKAALHPAQTDHLFFVARPDESGGHIFSRQLQAHQRAVERYRRGQKANTGEATRSLP